jgi:hypothetical protein
MFVLRSRAFAGRGSSLRRAAAAGSRSVQRALAPAARAR